jgi:hypothetical protein
VKQAHAVYAGAAILTVALLWGGYSRLAKAEEEETERRLADGKRRTDVDFQKGMAAIAARDATKSSCVLTVPRTKLDPYVFPSLEGAKEFDNAVVAQDSLAVSAAIRARGGYAVPRLTRCGLVEDVGGGLGLAYSQVRILEGARAGSVGWLPTSQTKGR